MARRHLHEDHVNHEAWAIPYGDLLTLLLAFFVVMRFINGYGDQNPWTVQPRGTVYTILSFLNITKYPASLLYYACTLGVSMVALAILENRQNAFTRVMNVFGRVPFFYYVIHFFAIHFITVIILVV